MRVLRDEELRPTLDLPGIVSCIEEGYRLDARGEVTTLPRFRADAAGLGVAWLGAAIPSRNAFGFRTYVYRPDGYDRREQLVALYDHSSMQLRAIFAGGLVGNLRTGAAMAAALHLVEPGLVELGVIGSGYQARNGLTCLAAVYPRLRVVVWSPDGRHRSEFASWAESTLRLRAEPVATATEVVERSLAVVLATSAEATVISRDMVRSPRLFLSISAYRRPEIDGPLFDACERIWTDSVAQAGGPGTFFSQPGPQAKLHPLGRGVEDGSARDRSHTRIILNTGAPWEEVLVAQVLLDAAIANGLGTEVEVPEVGSPSDVF